MVAQELPKIFEEKVAFCNSNLSNKQVIQLRKELNDLENFYLLNGFLTDKSGSSYRAVYEQIVRENDLIFKMDTTFELLHNLEYEVYTGCFYKVLTLEQMSQLTTRHLEASKKMWRDYEQSNATPGLAAQLILENFTEDDFELEYFRVSALLTFYRIASSPPTLNMGVAKIEVKEQIDIETIQVILNQNDEILIDNKIFTNAQAAQSIYEFLIANPESRGIEFTASRGASYETYLKTTAMFDSLYSKLASGIFDIPKNIIFRESN